MAVDYSEEGRCDIWHGVSFIAYIFLMAIQHEKGAIRLLARGPIRMNPKKTLLEESLGGNQLCMNMHLLLS